MAKLAGFQRLIKEDFPEESRPLIDKIGFSVNNFAEQVINIINNKQLTASDNLNEEVKNITVSVDGTGKPKATTTFVNNLNTRLQGIIVIRAQNTTNTNSYPISMPLISYVEVNSVVTILNISGLQADNNYTLTIRTSG